MILYEYRCVACRSLFTARRPMDRRNEPAECPACGGPGRRVVSVPQRHVDAWGVPRSGEELRTTKEIWE